MSKLVKTDLDFESIARIKNLPDAIDPQDPITKAQMDSAVEGLAWKDSARGATTSNINLAAPGAAVDGVTMATSDRVLVMGQTSLPENGIYIWNGAAVPMTRSTDASTFLELEQAIVTVEEGTSAGTSWRQTQVNGTIGANDVLWTSFGASVPVATDTITGTIKKANQGQVDAGIVDDAAVTPATLAAWSGKLKRYSATFGDGAATQYVLTHNLGTQDVSVTVKQAAGAYSEIICEVEATSINSVTLKFASAPALNSLRATILG